METWRVLNVLLISAAVAGAALKPISVADVDRARRIARSCSGACVFPPPSLPLNQDYAQQQMTVSKAGAFAGSGITFASSGAASGDLTDSVQHKSSRQVALGLSAEDGAKNNGELNAHSYSEKSGFGISEYRNNNAASLRNQGNWNSRLITNERSNDGQNGFDTAGLGNANYRTNTMAQSYIDSGYSQQGGFENGANYQSGSQYPDGLVGQEGFKRSKNGDFSASASEKNLKDNSNGLTGASRSSSIYNYARDDNDARGSHPAEFGRSLSQDNQRSSSGFDNDKDNYEFGDKTQQVQTVPGFDNEYSNDAYKIRGGRFKEESAGFVDSQHIPGRGNLQGELGKGVSSSSGVSTFAGIGSKHSSNSTENGQNVSKFNSEGAKYYSHFSASNGDRFDASSDKQLTRDSSGSAQAVGGLEVGLDRSSDGANLRTHGNIATSNAQSQYGKAIAISVSGK